MKNKSIYKFLSLILILSIAINTFVITGNATNESHINADMLVKINNHIESKLPGYLKYSNLYGLEVTTSKPLIIYNWDDENIDYERYLCFIFNDENIIGKLTMAEYDGEIVSSFDIGDFIEVNNVFNQKIPVVFGSYDKCLIMKSEIDTIVISGIEKGDTLSELSSEGDNTLISKIDSKIFKSAPPTRDSVIQLNVLSTANALDDQYYGLCWAASAASKIRYHYGNSQIVKGVDLSCNAGARAIYKYLVNKGIEYPDGKVV